MNLIPWRQKRENGTELERSEHSRASFRKEMDNLFDRFLRDPWGIADSETSGLPLSGMPRTDLADSENEVIVTMELPGVDPKDLDINLAGDLLTVRGERKDEKKEKRKNYHYVERQQGSFHRTVRLPSTVDPSKIDATFKNGVLSVSIAKHPEAKPKQITVRNA